MTEQQFMDASADKEVARIACEFSRCWNTLDPDPFLALITADTTYDSQVVLAPLVGDDIRDYFVGKMETFRRLGPEARAFVEVGWSQERRSPVAIMYQRTEILGSGVGERAAYAVFEATADGRCASVNLILEGVTKGSGVFPGIPDAELEEARRYTPAPPDVNGPLDFFVLTMNEQPDRLSQAMTDIVRMVTSQISRTNVHVLPVSDLRNHEFMREYGLTGYPALVVRSGERAVLKHVGVPPPQMLYAKLMATLGSARLRMGRGDVQ